MLSKNNKILNQTLEYKMDEILHEKCMHKNELLHNIPMLLKNIRIRFNKFRNLCEKALNYILKITSHRIQKALIII